MGTNWKLLKCNNIWNLTIVTAVRVRYCDLFLMLSGGSHSSQEINLESFHFVDTIWHFLQLGDQGSWSSNGCCCWNKWLLTWPRGWPQRFGNCFPFVRMYKALCDCPSAVVVFQLFILQKLKYLSPSYFLSSFLCTWFFLLSVLCKVLVWFCNISGKDEGGEAIDLNFEQNTWPSCCANILLINKPFKLKKTYFTFHSLLGMLILKSSA